MPHFAGGIFEVEKRKRVVPLLYAQIVVATAEVAFLGEQASHRPIILPYVPLYLPQHRALPTSFTLPSRACSVSNHSACM